MAEKSLAYRAREMNVLLVTFSGAKPVAKILGHGLGFTFVSKDVGLDDKGNLAPTRTTNYIHNFYLVLLVKLGLVGTAVMLGVLALWIVWSVHEARASRREPEKTFLIAASTVWIAAAVWNLACPELIDFRMAPLWGLLIAASVNAAEQGDSTTVGTT